MMLKTRAPAPPLAFPLTDDSTWTLAERRPKAMSLIVFYRGLHCPVCKGYLGELNRRLPEFTDKGVDVVAASSDEQARALTAKQDWGLDALALGHSVPIEDARKWGLFVSNAIRDAEPPMYFEPGLFLVDPAQILLYGAVNSASWGRPSLDDVVRGVSLITERKMPARGEA